MKNLSDSTLSVIDRASSKFGLLSTLLDKVVEKVVPITTASACAGSECVFTTCTSIRCGHFLAGFHYFSTAPRGCEQGIYTCRVSSCFC